MIADDRVAEWFGGNKDGVRLYRALCELGHKWDDLVDLDKPLEGVANKAFYLALVELPSNPIYAKWQQQLLPLWVAVISAYKTSNAYEAEGARKGLEISHTLRYAAGHIVAFLMEVTAGHETALKYLPEMWKDFVAEDFTEYEKEHLK